MQRPVNGAAPHTDNIMETQLTVHVGVTGKLDVPPEMREGVDAALRQVFATIRDTTTRIREDYMREATKRIREDYRDTYSLFDNRKQPVMRVISSLAKGVDTMAAQAAMEQGYDLQVPLPFERGVYAGDFAEGNEREQFFSLLAKADSVFEISSGEKGEHSARAYADAADVLLCHSDILVAVWDGAVTDYSAGTYATIRQAYTANIPVILIPMASPDSPRYRRGTRRSEDWKGELDKLLRFILLPATSWPDVFACAQESRVGTCWRWLREKVLRRRLPRSAPLVLPICDCSDTGVCGNRVKSRCMRAWRWLKGVFTERAFTGFLDWCHHVSKCGRAKGLGHFGKRLGVCCLSVFRKRRRPARRAAAPFDSTEEKYSTAEKWRAYRGDKLQAAANAYGEKSRNNLFRRYSLAVVCMIALIISINFPSLSYRAAWTALGAFFRGDFFHLHHWLAIFCSLVQLGSLLSILFYLFRDDREVEQCRHVTYRILSERCRQAEALAPAGFCRVYTADSEDPDVRWAAWYYRMMARQIGLPDKQGDQSVTREYLVKWAGAVGKGFLDAQARYHRERRWRSRLWNEALHNLAKISFVLLAVVSTLRFLVVTGCKYCVIPAAWDGDTLPLMGSLMLAFPCIGMFFAAYSNYANYQTQIASSSAMAEACRVLSAQARELAARPDISFSDVVALCRKIDANCSGEVRDWESIRNNNKSWNL